LLIDHAYHSQSSSLPIWFSCYFTAVVVVVVVVVVVLSFSSKRGHMEEKHVLIGRKHDKLGNQTFEFLHGDVCRSAIR